MSASINNNGYDNTNNDIKIKANNSQLDEEFADTFESLFARYIENFYINLSVASENTLKWTKDKVHTDRDDQPFVAVVGSLRKIVELVESMRQIEGETAEVYGTSNSSNSSNRSSSNNNISNSNSNSNSSSNRSNSSNSGAYTELLLDCHKKTSSLLVKQLATHVSSLIANGRKSLNAKISDNTNNINNSNNTNNNSSSSSSSGVSGSALTRSQKHLLILIDVIGSFSNMLAFVCRLADEMDSIAVDAMGSLHNRVMDFCFEVFSRFKEDKDVSGIIVRINHFNSNYAINKGIVSSVSENENIVNLSRLNELIDQLLSFRDLVDEYFSFVYNQVLNCDIKPTQLVIFKPFFSKWREIDAIYTSIEQGYMNQALYYAASETHMTRIDPDNASVSIPQSIEDTYTILNIISTRNRHIRSSKCIISIFQSIIEFLNPMSFIENNQLSSSPTSPTSAVSVYQHSNFSFIYFKQLYKGCSQQNKCLNPFDFARMHINSPKSNSTNTANIANYPPSYTESSSMQLNKTVPAVLLTSPNKANSENNYKSSNNTINGKTAIATSVDPGSLNKKDVVVSATVASEPSSLSSSVVSSTTSAATTTTTTTTNTSNSNNNSSNNSNNNSNKDASSGWFNSGWIKSNLTTIIEVAQTTTSNVLDSVIMVAEGNELLSKGSSSNSNSNSSGGNGSNNGNNSNDLNESNDDSTIEYDIDCSIFEYTYEINDNESGVDKKSKAITDFLTKISLIDNKERINMVFAFNSPVITSDSINKEIISELEVVHYSNHGMSIEDTAIYINSVYSCTENVKVFIKDHVKELEFFKYFEHEPQNLDLFKFKFNEINDFIIQPLMNIEASYIHTFKYTVDVLLTRPILSDCFSPIIIEYLEMASYKMSPSNYDTMVKGTSFLLTAVKRLIHSLSYPTKQSNNSNIHILRFLSSEVKCELIHQIGVYISEMMFRWIAGKLFITSDININNSSVSNNSNSSMNSSTDGVDSDEASIRNLKGVVFSELGAMYFKREVDSIVKLFEDLYINEEDIDDSMTNISNRYGESSPTKAGAYSKKDTGCLDIPLSISHTSPRESFQKLTSICSILTIDSLLELPDLIVDNSLFSDKSGNIKAILLAREDLPKEAINKMKI